MLQRNYPAILPVAERAWVPKGALGEPGWDPGPYYWKAIPLLRNLHHAFLVHLVLGVLICQWKPIITSLPTSQAQEIKSLPRPCRKTGEGQVRGVTYSQVRIPRPREDKVLPKVPQNTIKS